ncbi:MAG: D-alanine--D-alanine ligase family protein [Actinomycetota bacterium]
MSEVAVICGGPSPEHDISILTGLQVARLLQGGPHRVTIIYWTRSGAWQAVPNNLEGSDFTAGPVRGATVLGFGIPGGFSEVGRFREKSLSLDVALNCCHGGPGEDGTLGAMLELAGIRVSGPPSEASAWSMDKLATAGMVMLAGLSQFGVEAIPTIALDPKATAIDLPAPWVVKPRFGGSSLGVAVGVDDFATVLALSKTGISRSGAVVQSQLVGWSDLNVALRVFPGEVVSAIERPLTAGRSYGYDEKYLSGAEGLESARRELPAKLSSEVRERIVGATLALGRTVGLTGLPRVDFLYDGAERLALCEVNAIPGSLGLYLWAASGLGRLEVVLDLIEEALTGRVGRSHWAASTDGAALRAAKTVASKLG